MTGDDHDEESVQLIEQWLSLRFGLQFAGAKRDLLRNRLRQRLAASGMDSYFDYFIALRAGSDPEEIGLLVDAVTNGETYFFREEEQILAYLQELQTTGGRSDLRVLSAGCSTGEEAYTLAIRFGEALSWTRHVHVDACDLDELRLSKARTALYHGRALRATTDAQRETYFQDLSNGLMLVRGQYRSMVRFFAANLLEPESLPQTGKYDAIFCRNVLIYFSEAAIDAALTSMALWLRPGGTLYLGHSESIVGRSPFFRTERSGDCIIYRRTEDTAEVHRKAAYG